MKKIGLFISSAIIAFSLNAQTKKNQAEAPAKLKPAKSVSIIIENPSIPADSGKIEVQEDVNVGILVQKYNSTKKDVGYRVQIHSGLARIEAINAQSNFLKIYPDVPTYLIYQQPNFKIRVGDFENRIQVLQFYDEMIGAFPGSFVIKDDINASF